MSCPTFKVSVGFPVFGLGFTADNQLILCGGGGASRSGVKNKLAAYKIDARRKDLEEDATFEFAATEDAPMCLSVHPSSPHVVVGVNESEQDMEQGTNNNCRTFKILEDKLELEKAINTLKSNKAKDYQKVVRFNEKGTLVATGTTDRQVQVFKYPEFDSVSQAITVSEDEKEEVLDVDINLENEKLTCVLANNLKLINLRGKNVGQVVQTISSSTIIIRKNTVKFRAFRYGRGFSKDFGFAVANGFTKPGAYIAKYDAYSLDQIKVVKVGNKPITAFAISQDGAVLAFASADLSITLLDAASFRILTRIKDAHGFSITCIAVSPDRRLIASASADNTCRIVSLPIQFGNGLSINPIYTLVLACTVAAILVWILNFVELQPLFRLEDDNNALEVTDATKTIVPQMSTSLSSIDDEIASEMPVIQVVSEPIIAADDSKTINQDGNTNRDEL
ncbi:WD40-repeat-containing domain protein [Parasitella parasitica]|nr:WD40-repeat-containing domain protein [Parasitella parasitica]